MLNHHSTRLKEQLLSSILELEEQEKDVMYCTHSQMILVLSCLRQTNIKMLAKAGNIVQRDMLNHKIEFSNKFHSSNP